MSYPPYPADPNRPADPSRPQDTPPSEFPRYGRPQDPAAPFVPPGSPVQGSPYQGPPQYPQYPGSQYPQPGYGYGYQAVNQVRTNGLATAALICGLVAIFVWFVAPIAVGLGIAALIQIKRRQESGTAQAVVGLCLGSLMSLVGVVVLIFMFAIDWTGSEHDYGSDQPVASYYIGISPDKSVRKSSFWWPDEELWKDGDRVVVCAAYGSGSEQLHGSVKGTKR